MLGATRMGRDEIRYQLLAQPRFAVDTQEQVTKAQIVLPRRLAHEFQDRIRAMLGCHLQSSGHMARYQLLGVRFAHQIVANTGPHKSVLHVRQFVHRTQDVQQRSKILIQIFAYSRLQATGACTFLTKRHILAVHSVHVRRWSTQVADDAVPIRQAAQTLYLAQDGCLAATHYLLALVGRDGAERATAKTAAMHTYRPLDHVVRRNAFVLVFGVRRVLIRQIEHGIQLFGRHRRIGRIDHHVLFPHRLYQRGLMDLVGLNLHQAEVLSMFAFVAYGFFVRSQMDCILRQVGDIVG